MKESRTTILHQLRRAASWVGLDVQRVGITAPARLSGLLRGRGVECVLDVGANQGQYGRRLRQFGYRGEIRSFEPLPEAFRFLVRHTARDPKWSASNLALGDEDRVVSLNIAGNEAAASSSVLPMLSRHKEAVPDSSYVGAIDVPMRRLDSIWDEVVTPGATPFVKLDVQGFEGAVLDGATNSLEDVIGVQLEVSLVALYEGALTWRDVLDRTDALGMHLVHVEPGFWDPRTGELLQMDGVFMRSTVRSLSALG